MIELSDVEGGAAISGTVLSRYFRSHSVTLRPMSRIDGTVVGGDPGVGVEIEAVELGLAGAARGGVTEIRLVTEAAHAHARATAEGDPTLDGGAREAGRKVEVSPRGSAYALSSSGST
jgi:hypothetical protein